MPYKNEQTQKIYILLSYAINLCGNLYVLKSLQDLVVTHYSRNEYSKTSHFKNN
jgi:hypothetical protein